MRCLLLPLLAMYASGVAAQAGKIENLAPYTPTPDSVVDRMLKLGALQPGQKVFDLGSGDGRIVIMAAQKYLADATGVEFDDVLFTRSMERIRQLGLSSKARIIHGDLLRQDYAAADVITVYLLPFGNAKLVPILEKQLKKGARIVSHNAPFPTWTAVKVEEIENDGEGSSHRIYLYQR